MKNIFSFAITLLLCLCFFSLTAFADNDSENTTNTDFQNYINQQNADVKSQSEFYKSELEKQITFYNTHKIASYDGWCTFMVFLQSLKNNNNDVSVISNINNYYSDFFYSEDYYNLLIYFDNISTANLLLNTTTLDYTSSSTLEKLKTLYNNITSTRQSALDAYNWYSLTVLYEGETFIEKAIYFWVNNAANTVKEIGNNVKNALDPKTFGIDYTKESNVYFAAITAFANCLLVIFVGLGVIKSGLQYDLFTARGGVKIFGGLLLGKLLVDNSIKISNALIGTINDLAGELLFSASNKLDKIDIKVNTDGLVYSDNKYVGEIINFFNNFGMILWSLLICLVLLVISVLVLLKLMLRTFELSLLVAVSPCFMACASSEATRPYFTRFLTTLISVAANIVFMALVYSMFGNYLSAGGTSFEITSDGFGDWIIVIIAMGIAMVKPPKILTNLIS